MSDYSWIHALLLGINTLLLGGMGWLIGSKLNLMDHRIERLENWLFQSYQADRPEKRG